MNPAWLDLQAQCDALVRQWRDGLVVDLTSSDAIDVRDEHDPITGEVLDDRSVA